MPSSFSAALALLAGLAAVQAQLPSIADWPFDKDVKMPPYKVPLGVYVKTKFSTVTVSILMPPSAAATPTEAPKLVPTLSWTHASLGFDLNPTFDPTAPDQLADLIPNTPGPSPAAPSVTQAPVHKDTIVWNIRLSDTTLWNTLTTNTVFWNRISSDVVVPVLSTQIKNFVESHTDHVTHTNHVTLTQPHTEHPTIVQPYTERTKVIDTGFTTILSTVVSTEASLAQKAQAQSVTPTPTTSTNSIPVSDLRTTGLAGGRSFEAFIGTVTSYYPLTFTSTPEVALQQGPYNMYGCYSDTPGGNYAIIPKNGLDTRHTSSFNMDLQPCEIFCRNSPYIGLRNGNECFCGDKIHDRAEKVDIGKCNIQCAGYPGDAPQSCGGNGTVLVYANLKKIQSSSSPYVRPTQSFHHNMKSAGTRSVGFGLAAILGALLLSLAVVPDLIGECLLS